MKKLFSFVLVLFSFLLVACRQLTEQSVEEPNPQSSLVSEQVRVQLIVKFDQSSQEKTLTLEKEETIMTILKANYDVKEVNGFITAIDGVEQDEAAKRYWLFKVNGQMAPKGADQMVVKDGDVIEFYQESF
ncbi:DUF4430 domain-containing protein [Streptococcus sp. sy010]|uniref:DUF4430 domain-containing protein n=1 Tax=Streptococcus sp. sy010 TaxID=2600148 RepID=UPI0011B84180|nr:DUF4430 domain-containing protein [Streptococcus sp. sy010]TWT14719.1 DUF4430 domain-containing protein [Streptococcus sp. sy010]